MNQEPKFGKTFKVFNNQFHMALTAQYTVAQADDYPTITLELANITTHGPDWQNKTTLQLTRYELTAFTEVLLGLKPSTEGSYHGFEKNKGFSLHNNAEKGVFLVLSKGGAQKQMGLSPMERNEFLEFTIRRLANAWDMNVADVVALLRHNRQFQNMA